MKFLLRSISIGRHKLSFAAIIWFVLGAITVLSEVLRGRQSVNNYIVYEGVF